MELTSTTAGEVEQILKSMDDSLLFCPLCFATEEDGSGGGTVLVAYCLNCGAGNSTVTLPRWAVENIRQQASWVGKRFYPHEEDREARDELQALRGTVTHFPGRTARQSGASASPRQWSVTQELPGGRAYSVYVDAGSEAEAFEEARYSLPYVPGLSQTPSSSPPSHSSSGEHTATLFECRCCGNGTRGKTDGSFDSLGWARITGIDGPNAICPECRADPEALDGLRADGYENAWVVETSPTEE